MASSHFDKHGVVVHGSADSMHRFAGPSRGAPFGPRKPPEKPTRHRTIDTSSLSTSSTVRSASNANRSQTFDSHDVRTRVRPFPAAAGPSRAYSASQPADSPLSTVSDTNFPTVGHSGSPGSMSLLSSKSHSHVAGMTLPARLGPGRSLHEFRKVSVASTDSNLGDAGAHLDFKRLMSKPAVHTTSSSSAISLPSDSELSAASRQFAQATAVSFGLHASRQDRLGLRPPSRDSSSPHRSPSREPPGLASHTMTLSSQPISLRQEKEPPKKPNVLKRRPSTAETQHPASRTLPSRRRKRSVDGLRLSATEAGVVQLGSPGKDSLTPAGEVALAYKQQEQRRSELEQMSGWDDGDSRRMPSEGSSGGSRERHTIRRGVSMEIAEEEETTGPYYTVFGSGAGHMDVASSAFVGDVAPSTGGEHVKKSKRTLSRKMSGSFKKVADIVMGEREYSGHSREESWRTYDQGSLQNSPTHRSIRTARNDPHSPHSPRSLQDREWPTGREHCRDDGGARAGPSRLGYNKSLQSDREDNDGSGKWWRLVKRISTGGLRDKYRDRPRAATPPPVPPLPLGTQKRADSRATFEILSSPVKEVMAEDRASAKSSPAQTRSSGSGQRPGTGSSQKTSSRHTVASRPSTGGKYSSTPSVPRPSTATRSPSPIFSEPASSGFFQKAHSTRSSSSSYGEEIPPLPVSQAPAVGTRIMSPEELGRLDTSRPAPKVSSTRKPVRAASAPNAEFESYATSSADEKPHSLRPPPRRPGTNSRDASSQERSPSPTLPSFSTADCVNTFSPTALSPGTLPLSEFGPAPPRPKRSSRRVPASIEVPSAAAANALHSARSPPTPRTPRPVKTSLDRFAPSRDSTSTVNVAALAKMSTPSLTSSPVSASTSPSSVSSQRSPPTFRELETSRQAWSEQEKQDKWEALLERSARAGGTLHIGETGLLSDSIRLSKYEL
ncbi:hypothetical protein DAEQUDRAFT_756206 [Daedalea quercina L-15889]|uniref:Uncharacterized protein n=1 Tax=Daedalea quercina L-15889 TaxID=1314783 RepID=A0A165RKU7_9APHY|nr:hypothetical protein DAEQUDRAFT_756206 [Daedalea quercina L-15889]